MCCVNIIFAEIRIYMQILFDQLRNSIVNQTLDILVIYERQKMKIFETTFP